ncbi:MAG: type II secretion system F family protein [Actinomycetota bacterium]
MKRPRIRLRIPAIVLASLAVAPSAVAGVRIGGVDVSGYPQVRLTVVAPSSPSILENGVPVSGVQTTNLGRAKSVVLAVDRSQSMQGGSLADATAAARAFADAKASGDRVEVITFGHEALTLSRFSSSAIDADAALTGLRADTRPGTALWDAVARAAAALRHEDQPGHVIIVVTDGRDVSSTSTLDDAIAAAQRAHAAVYAVGIAGPEFTPAPLQQLAARTGGAYLEASSSAELTSLYRRIDRALADTWQVEYVTARRPGDTVAVRAVVPGAQAAVRDVRLDAAGAAAPAGPAPTVLSRRLWRSPLAPLVLSVAVGLLVLVAMVFLTAVRAGSRLNARIAPHLGTPQRVGQAKPRRQGQSFRRQLVGATEHAFTKFPRFRALQGLLTRADLPLLAAELLYVALGVAVVFGLVSALTGVPSLLVLAFMAGGFALPIAWVAYRAKKRMKAFDNQLADLLITIAASLKAGHSFRHAIQAVVDEGGDPAAKEFRRVLTETRLGRPMDQALTEMGDRVGSKNLTFVLNSVTIQRQIGGSLAGLFDMVAETVRQRQQFARKIRSLTAMGRMSAYVLGGLPFAVAILISLISPTYMRPLWHSGTGHALVAIGCAMLAFGAVFLRKIVSFKG